MIKFKLPKQQNLPVYCGAAFVFFLAFAVSYIANHPHVDVCRGVILDDIRVSQQYQATLDQLLRPDYLNELTKGQK